ncbi:hypothetical protein BGZ63DRAFT_423731 [Mariannaea sp. PMI_226]|nr:hypothetical protein BGZ63DRAFT_423731 [Mariannaea sp. PMI_226]
MERHKDHDLVVPIGDFVEPASTHGSDHEEPATSVSKRRHATVYDAVAGKVSYNQGLQDGETEAFSRRIKYSTKETPFAPDEVLFRRQDAPERYLEHDIYFANERELPRAGQGILPESDLLKAIHGYASAFYHAKSHARNPPNNRNIAERSMDETALLAFGILLEEAGKDALGRRGDLVFTEGAEDASGLDASGDVVSRADTGIGHQEVTMQRRAKRRKVAETDDD